MAAALSRDNGPRAETLLQGSGAEALDQRGYLLGLVVMHHMPRLIDDLLAPVWKSLEARLELVERNLAGNLCERGRVGGLDVQHFRRDLAPDGHHFVEAVQRRPAQFVRRIGEQHEAPFSVRLGPMLSEELRARRSEARVGLDQTAGNIAQRRVTLQL